MALCHVGKAPSLRIERKKQSEERRKFVMSMTIGGYTQKEIAHKLGISTSRVTQILSQKDIPKVRDAHDFY